MFKFLMVISTVILITGCAGKSLNQQKTWNEMLDGSSFKQIGFNPAELENNK